MDVEKRRVDLEKWLGALVWRCDVLSSQYFYDFCNVFKILIKLAKLLDRKWLQ